MLLLSRIQTVESFELKIPRCKAGCTMRRNEDLSAQTLPYFIPKWFKSLPYFRAKRLKKLYSLGLHINF